MHSIRQLTELEQQRRELFARTVTERRDCIDVARRFRAPIQRVDRMIALWREISRPRKPGLTGMIGLLGLTLAGSPRLSFARFLGWNVIRRWFVRSH